MMVKAPKYLTPDADEAERITRIQIARFYGIAPAQVDSMSEADYNDTLHIMWAEEQINKRGN